jgi:hypothetical protein
MPIDVSRSELDTRATCETKNFTEYHYAGTGITKVKQALPLASGIALHEANALVLESYMVTGTVALDAAIQHGLNGYHEKILKSGIANADPEHLSFTAGEQKALIEALIRGWRRYRVPDIAEQYDIIEVEKEHRVHLAYDVYQQVRFDAVLQPKSTRYIVVMDEKSTANEGADWAERLRRSSQTHLYVPAAEDIFGMYVAGVQYEGMFKGARRKGTGKWADRKLQGSPLVYGYKGPDKEGNTAYQVEGTTRKGWEKFAVWEEEGMTVERWMDEFISPDILKGLYQSVPPWRPLDSDMEDNRKLVAQREIEWRLKIEPGINLSITDPAAVPEWASKNLLKNRGACLMYGGDHRCPMWDFCYNRTVAADPLGSGIYQPREDHHADVEDGED